MIYQFKEIAMPRRDFLAGGPATIDIVMLFDISLIFHDFPPTQNSATNPIGLPHGGGVQKYAYMVAPDEYLFDLKTNATPDLEIAALTNDQINWRALTYNGNINHGVGIVKLSRFGGDRVVSGFNPLDNPGTYVDFDPVKGEPYVTKEARDCHFNSLVIGYGTENYGVTVYLGEVNRRTGQVDNFGYYYWDPAIHCVRP
ncbi:hypothetical protein CO709_29685 [Burkholderia thailandensis]|uniref:AidA/PixA family protein n=1 Tax=Burkholderia humptydooensis TaxID=430531 RepID=UPI00094FD327|nr:AidA/PixA family protein [Burkholderia humptydooensis]ATF37004.1 hypothetical protein CO709_29685 [Burkholderia thailandensis]